MKKIQVIDLFSGIGGLSYGLRQANIEVLAGIDNDETCKMAFEENNGATFLHADISTFDFSKLENKYHQNAIRVLVGCAPCQPFSSHSNKYHTSEADNRWNLLDHFIRGVKVLKPDIVSMENVRGVTSKSVFSNFVSELNQLGYEIDFKVVYAPDFGVPQNRTRLILLASKIGQIKVPEATHNKNTYVTVKDVIATLPPISAGETYAMDPLHKTNKLTEINLKRIKQSKPGGSWKDWDQTLLPNCFKKDSGKSYTPVYGRMKWDEVAPTITTQFTNYGSGRFGHPSQNRALSLREGALLQSFPIDYRFNSSHSMNHISRQIGNAVPPKLGYVIGESIKKHVNEYGRHQV